MAILKLVGTPLVGCDLTPADDELLILLVPGGTDVDYFIFAYGDQPISGDPISVAGGGLTWTAIANACTGRGTGSAELFHARGSPAGPFTATITYSGTGDVQGAVLVGYTGGDVFEDAHYVNTNGVAGACSGGSDSGSTPCPCAAVSHTSTVPDALFLMGIVHRLGTVTAVSPVGWTLQSGPNSCNGGGGNSVNNNLYDRIEPLAMTIASDLTLNSDQDWVHLAVILKPAVVPPSGGGKIVGVRTLSRITRSRG